MTDYPKKKKITENKNKIKSENKNEENDALRPTNIFLSPIKMDSNTEVTGDGPPPGDSEGVDQPPTAPPTQKKAHQKDWLAVGGIGIEKRRRSSNASYRIENNKVM